MTARAIAAPPRFQLVLPILARGISLQALAEAATPESSDAPWRIFAADGRGTHVQLVTPPLARADLGALLGVLRALRKLGARGEEGAYAALLFDPRGFDSRALANLARLIEKQAALLAAALGLDVTAAFDLRTHLLSAFGRKALVLTIPASLHTGDVAAAVLLALAILARARSTRGASAKPRPFDPESARYDFRCFLLRLGFVGEPFRAAREALCRRLPGSAAYKRGRPEARAIAPTAGHLPG